MMNGYGGWGMGAWLMMGVITLVVLAAIVVGVVALTRRSNAAAQAPAAAPAAGGSAAALRTLDERFARGEIDEAEYTKRRDLLTQR
jgi:putative membrane protein